MRRRDRHAKMRRPEHKTCGHEVRRHALAVIQIGDAFAHRPGDAAGIEPSAADHCSGHQRQLPGDE